MQGHVPSRQFPRDPRRCWTIIGQTAFVHGKTPCKPTRSDTVGRQAGRTGRQTDGPITRRQWGVRGLRTLRTISLCSTLISSKLSFTKDSGVAHKDIKVSETLPCCLNYFPATSNVVEVKHRLSAENWNILDYSYGCYLTCSQHSLVGENNSSSRETTAIKRGTWKGLRKQIENELPQSGVGKRSLTVAKRKPIHWREFPKH